jgi:hypothetical protein
MVTQMGHQARSAGKTLPQGNNLRDVALVNANTATVVGDTVSSGPRTEWYTTTQSSALRNMGCFFTDATNGTAVGENGTIPRTTDGGASWCPKQAERR